MLGGGSSGTLNIGHLLLTSILNQCSAVVPGDWNTECQLFAKPLALWATGLWRKFFGGSVIVTSCISTFICPCSICIKFIIGRFENHRKPLSFSVVWSDVCFSSFNKCNKPKQTKRFYA
jgi:hypothetical protein